MKKLLSIIIAFSMIASMLSFSAVFAANEEIVFSESFESGLGDWIISSAYSKSNITLSKAKVSDGKQSVYVVDDSDSLSPGASGKKFKVTAGQVYTTVADFLVEEGNAVKVYYKYFDADDKQIFNQSFCGKVGDWQTISIVTTAPEGAVTGQTVVSGTNKPLGKAYVDNIRVYKGEVKIGTLYQSGSSSTTSAPAATVKVVNQEPVVTEYGTIIYKESYESGMGEWSLTNASLADKIREENEKASDGKKSMYLEDDTKEKAPGIKSPHFAIKAGQEYTAYADMFTVGGNSIKLYFKFFDKDGKQVSSKSGDSVPGIWSTAKTYQTAPDNSVTAQVWICGVNANTGSAYADNIRVFEGNVKLPVPEVEFEEPVQTAPVNANIVAPVDNKLQYNTYNEQGDKLGDYSYGGFYAGEYELPVSAHLPVAMTLEPSADPKADDTERIQAAIDKVYNESSNDNMKIIKLKAGRYNINSGGISLKSGVVLSGEGQSIEGTILYAKDAVQHTPVKISGSAPKMIGEKAYITDEYVKAGSASFNIPSERIGDFNVGDLITIYHPSSEEWSNAMGMKGIINVYDNDTSWGPGKVDMQTERTITAINGTEITVDFPIFVPLMKKYAKSYISKISDDARVQNVGIENLRIESYYNGDPFDEKHATNAISISNAKNIFVRDVSAKHFYNALISSGKHCKQVTALNCSSLEPVSTLAGSRRYSFAVSTSAQQILYTGCYSFDGRHDFETSLPVTGPISFVDNLVDSSNTASETHGTWSTGVLYDNVYQISNSTKGFIAFANRGIYGTSLSQGWAAGNTVAWNCLASTIIGHKPPLGYQNFIVGTWGIYNDDISKTQKESNIASYTNIYRTAPKIEPTAEKFATSEGTSMVGDCYKEAEFTPVEPRSLYKAQLAERFTGNIQNARPNAPVIVYPKYDKETKDNQVKITGMYQLGAEKVTVYVDNQPYDAAMEASDNSFVLTVKLNEGTHKIYATQTIKGVEGTKTADRFVTVGKSNGNHDYLQSIYTPDKTRMIINDNRITFDEYLKNNTVGEVDEISIVVDKVKLEPDVKPYETHGRVLVPMRAIFEALNAEVSWDEATFTATAKNYFNTVVITENSTTAYVNGNPITLDAPATITNGRFMVPVRFISESFGATVDWIDLRKTVVVTSNIKIYEPSHDLPNELTVYGAIQSGDDGAGNVIDNAFDGDFSSGWAVIYRSDVAESAHGILDLGSSKNIHSLYIAFSSGTARVYTLDIFVSEDGVSYTPVVTDFKSSGKTNDMEEIKLDAKGKFVKIVGKGNSVNNWMNLKEIAVTGI